MATDLMVPSDRSIWEFGPALRPAVEVPPGTTVTLDVKDCFDGQIQTERDLVTEIDFGRVNGACGPVSVLGAMPGDSLVIDVLDIRLAPQGVTVLIPGVGPLHDSVSAPLTTVMTVSDSEVRMGEYLSFPLRPMVGVMGVATDGEVVSNLYAGRHGGNMDDRHHTIGSRIYFRVNQPGGLFAAGDMHASMGDGEVCGAGVDIAGQLDIRVDVLTGHAVRWPVTEVDDAWITHGTAPERPEDAIKAACEDAAHLLTGEWGLSMEEAYVFLSAACDVGICQAARPSTFSVIARVVIPKIDSIPGPFRIE